MSDDFHPTRVRGVTPVKVQRARELRRDMTPEERVLWQELRLLRQRGHTFRRQQIIAGFIADFYCHAARLVVEVDGGIHAQQTDYDAQRDTIIAAHGLTILRIPNADIHTNLPAVLAHITSYLPQLPPSSTTSTTSTTSPSASASASPSPRREKGPGDEDPRREKGPGDEDHQKGHRRHAALRQ